MEPRLNIGMYGSAQPFSPALEPLLDRLVQGLCEQGCNVITGGCPGIPYAVASRANLSGLKVTGYTPAIDIEEHLLFAPEDRPEVYSQLVFTSGEHAAAPMIVRKKLRNVQSTYACDGAIVIAGSWGTLHELSSLMAYGRPVGLLSGTGGVADSVSCFSEIGGASIEGLLFCNTDPRTLLRQVVRAAKQKDA